LGGSMRGNRRGEGGEKERGKSKEKWSRTLQPERATVYGQRRGILNHYNGKKRPCRGKDLGTLMQDCLSLRIVLPSIEEWGETFPSGKIR